MATATRSLTDLSKEMETYTAHKAELLAQHRGEYVLIKGAEIIGVFRTQEEALRHAYSISLTEPFLAHQINDTETPLYFYNFRGH